MRKRSVNINTTKYALEYDEPYETFYIPVTVSEKGEGRLYHQKTPNQKKSQFASNTDYESVFLCRFKGKGRITKIKKLDKEFWFWLVNYMMSSNAHLFTNHDIRKLIDDCNLRVKDNND